MPNPSPIGRNVAHLVEEQRSDEISAILNDEGLLGVMSGSLRDLFDVDQDADEALSPAETEQGPVFKIGYTRLGENIDVNSRFVKARILTSEKYHKEIKGYKPHISLSIEVDHESILIEGEGHEHTDDEDLMRISVRGLGSRVFYPGILFESVDEAQTYFDKVSDTFEGLIQEFGARGHQLIDNELVRSDDASNQKYDEALQRAVQLTNIEFGLTTGAGRYSPIALAHELFPFVEVPFHREAIKEDSNDLQITHYICDRDIGEFCFYEDDDGVPSFAHWTYPKHGEAGTVKEHYKGPITPDALHTHFVQWLAAAGRERGAISNDDFDILNEGRDFHLLSKIRQPASEVRDLREFDPAAKDSRSIIIPTAEEIARVLDPTVPAKRRKP